MYDIPTQRSLPSAVSSHVSAQGLMDVVLQALASMPLSQAVTKRGRPQRVSSTLLGMGILWCMLHGWVSQWDLWRRISFFGIGSLPAVRVCDQAIYNRLATHGSHLMQDWCAQVTIWLGEWMQPYEDRQIAPKLKEIVALDESIMDKVHRWLPEMRNVPAGSRALFAGRLVGLFDVRRQVWRRLDWLTSSTTNCPVHAPAMVEDLAAGTTVLFDLGYYGFEWLDTLSRQGLWWITRLKSNASYTVEHVLIQRDDYLEALIFLGAYRADRTAYLCRMVKVRYRGQWYEYLTNLTDPCLVSGADIVRLYARRWDIELAFRMLKEYLGLRWLWSAKASVIGAQLWATVLLAQVLHALQVRTAAQLGVDPFDVSLELLLRYLPDLSQQAERESSSVMEVLERTGRELFLVRPNTRTQMQVPTIAWWEMAPFPVDLTWIRQPRYAHKQHGNTKKQKEADPHKQETNQEKQEDTQKKKKENRRQKKEAPN